MRIKPGFRLREIAGETVVVNPSAPSANLTRIISLNSSARLLWERLQGKDFTLEEVVSILTDNYEVSETQALADAKTWAESLENCGLLS